MTKYWKLLIAIRPTDYLVTVVVGIALLGVAAYFGIHTGVFDVVDLSVRPGEIDLSGTWKIQYSDRPEYARADLDDSSWCLTTIPNPRKTPEVRAEDHPSSSCPKENYPVETMQNTVFWYRKTFEITKANVWQHPSLFVGSIKHEGEFFWDGVAVGYVDRAMIPMVLNIPTSLAHPGPHSLAIRIRANTTPYPGLIHGLRRGFVLGDTKANATAQSDFRWSVDRTAFAIVGLQFLLLLLGVLLLRVGEANSRMKWLLVFLFSAFLMALRHFLGLEGNLYQMAYILALGGYGVSLLGYSCAQGVFESKLVNSVGLSITLLGFGAILLVGPRDLATDITFIVLLAATATGLAVSIGTYALKRVKQSFSFWEKLILYALTLHAGLNLGFNFLHNSWFNSRPELQSLSITLLVIGFELEEYVQKKIDLSFFGRFIRTGLKDLLVTHRREATSGQKIFRGRRVVILKIDVIQHTATTYGMPYGLKRLYQDCWFSTIDRLVSNHSFMDKGLGDGSLYYFDDTNSNAAGMALEVVSEINRQGLRHFDLETRKKMEELIGKAPELMLPARRFFAHFATRNGSTFEEHRTRARYALLAGMLDEGLWGMLERGHYDLEGDLITVAARIEKKAGTGGLVINREFLNRLGHDSRRRIEQLTQWNTDEFKGIGNFEYGLIKDLNAIGDLTSSSAAYSAA